MIKILPSLEIVGVNRSSLWASRDAAVMLLPFTSSACVVVDSTRAPVGVRGVGG